MPQTRGLSFAKLARPERFELPTSWFVPSSSMGRKSMILAVTACLLWAATRGIGRGGHRLHIPRSPPIPG
jgi:hypothetical protein